VESRQRRIDCGSNENKDERARRMHIRIDAYGENADGRDTMNEGWRTCSGALKRESRERESASYKRNEESD